MHPQPSPTGSPHHCSFWECKLIKTDPNKLYGYSDHGCWGKGGQQLEIIPPPPYPPPDFPCNPPTRGESDKASDRRCAFLGSLSPGERPALAKAWRGQLGMCVGGAISVCEWRVRGQRPALPVLCFPGTGSSVPAPFTVPSHFPSGVSAGEHPEI